MSFMAVAYVPAFLEDRANYVKERANGLYGPTAFLISNFIIGLPYLCKYFKRRETFAATVTDAAAYSPLLGAFLSLRVLDD